MPKKTPDILKKILDYKIEYIEQSKRKISLNELKHLSDDCPPRRGSPGCLLGVSGEPPGGALGGQKRTQKHPKVSQVADPQFAQK